VLRLHRTRSALALAHRRQPRSGVRDSRARHRPAREIHLDPVRRRHLILHLGMSGSLRLVKARRRSRRMTTGTCEWRRMGAAISRSTALRQPALDSRRSRAAPVLAKLAPEPFCREFDGGICTARPASAASHLNDRSSLIYSCARDCVIIICVVEGLCYSAGSRDARS